MVRIRIVMSGADQLLQLVEILSLAHFLAEGLK